MNIHELDTYDLGDAVKFNDELNPKIWDDNERMRPEVREQLLRIADDFREFLGINVEVKDITVSGSNAAYTYTPHSDIDLHLVVDLPRADENAVYRELFDAKKYAYNDMHDIKIGGYDVELYVQDANKTHHSQGIYSIQNDDWVSVPKRRRPDVDDISVRSKFEDLGHRIESAIASGDIDKITDMAEKLRDYRQAGLDAHGEFGAENLAFKILRTQGLIEKLYAARNRAKDELLSLDERKRKKKKRSVKYGYGAYWYPGTAYAGQDHPAGTEGGDGGGGDGGESLREGVPDTQQILQDFVEFAVEDLGIQRMPAIKLRRDPQWPVVNRTFGRYNNDAKTLEVAWGQRHIMDVLRTVAHELTHKHQHERDGDSMGDDAGETGSAYENEANAQAGILMRDYAALHPEYFTAGQAQDLEEGASGYIPTKAQAKDPRFSMALTQDIRPGQIGKEANKLKLKTDSQGQPQIARANGLFETLMAEYAQVKEGIQAPVAKDRDEQQYLKFVLGKVRLGRVLNRQEQEFLKNYQLKKQVAEDEDLDEVKMSPGALEKFATSDAAKGIRAGFEAELIFRDTQGSRDDIDPEPNYDADERAYSVQQVIEFFTQDEYGYGLTDRERNRLEERLDEAYLEWRDNQMTQDFRNEAEDLVREIYLNETPMGERIIKVLTDGMDIDDARADKILAMGVDAPRFTNSSEQAAYVEQNPDYKIYLEALDDAEAILDEEVETSIEKQDGYHDQALDNYRDNYSGDDDSFFSDVGLRWMSDVANEYGLDWPVWDMDNQRNNGSRNWEDIGAELQAVVDMPVLVSDNYHSARRRPGQWILEPDGSLGPDDQSQEAGLEIVSPPLPLLTAIEKLKQVTDWANDPQGGNAYTNATTGLHMGVSLPRFTSEDADSDAGIDYVKLILFMGDKYVLDQFGRTANTYTASALDKLKQNIRGKRSDPAGVVELLRYGLTELAQRELQKGVGTSKYTSAHIQNGYIEFRSPGGDWLAKSDEEIGILENTMLRFARAMAIAGDPSADRQEYAKKLYKLVTQDNDEYADQLKLFSEYSAGTINKEQLKKQWAEKTIGKELGDKEEQDWEVYDVKTGKTLEIVKGKNRGEVADAVFDKYANQGIGFNVRAYQDPATMTPRAKLAKRITTKPKTPVEYNYEIVNTSTGKIQGKGPGEILDQMYAQTPQQAQQLYSEWLRERGFADDTQDIGYRKSAQAADDQRDSVDIQRTLGIQDVDTDVAQNFSPDYSAYERNSDRIDAIRAQSQQPRQNYELVSDEDPDRVIHRMSNATADQVRAYIAQQEAGGMPPGFLRTRIVAESMESQQEHTALDRAAQKLKFQDWADAQQRGSPYAIKAIQEIVRRTHSDSQPAPARSAIGQAINQAELDALTQQIQIARRLGDDVNEGQVVQMPANTAQARRLARDWVGIYQDADATNRKQLLAAKQRELIALGWLLVRNPKYGVVLRHTDTGAMIPLNRITENFADGRVKGKSRPGRVKRAGASCNGSVTDLRRRAKNASGEKAKMYHWCANMKSGRKK